ncbi:hypothetical protein CW751_07940 [Brumimicrobium salinarum]|uniref:Uncharacterized protein n=1 Tax=Brumimicrobium salinarum TaxID=2058658 RepID=A0A2I0R286_9FLAO|nr:hypothetical protein [Brumimicrobium salinarum]PKR80692.1 hypothetical protein CW751_07940 [Brumimicrobium salinarum]
MKLHFNIFLIFILFTFLQSCGVHYGNGFKRKLSVKKTKPPQLSKVMHQDSVLVILDKKQTQKSALVKLKPKNPLSFPKTVNKHSEVKNRETYSTNIIDPKNQNSSYAQIDIFKEKPEIDTHKTSIDTQKVYNEIEKVDDPSKPINRALRIHPIIIVLATLYYFYLQLIGLGIVFFVGLYVLSIGGTLFLAIPVWLLLGYLVTAVHLYFVSQLFERTDGSGTLTMREALRKTILIFFGFVLACLALFLIYW